MKTPTGKRTKRSQAEARINDAVNWLLNTPEELLATPAQRKSLYK
jgi:hypothetical protein